MRRKKKRIVLLEVNKEKTIVVVLELKDHFLSYFFGWEFIFINLTNLYRHENLLNEMPSVKEEGIIFDERTEWKEGIESLLVRRKK